MPMIPDTSTNPSLSVAWRADLHVHSRASSGPALAALGWIGCPESYSPPERVYEVARARGMDLVTITDHDTIDGAIELVERGFERIVVGEEVTVFFPEDRCKLHVLFWGLTPEQHEAIQPLRDDIYTFAAYLSEQNLAHALAHPLYVQNGRLGRSHIERCALLFKGFETLNGAHSRAIRDPIERFLSALTPTRIQAFADRHGMLPSWSRVWEKARTGGSDDHALLNVGRTWTAVDFEPDELPDVRLFFRRLMGGRCEPGGEAGHSSLLAHQLSTVGAHYAARTILPRAGARTRLGARSIARFAGIDIPRPGLGGMIRAGLGQAARRLAGRRPSPLLGAFRAAAERAIASYPDLTQRLGDARAGPAIGEHERMAEFFDEVSGMAAAALGTSAIRAWMGKDGRGVADHLSAYAMLAAAQLPYIVSLFHQNKEREFLRQFSRETMGEEQPTRILLFTDTLGDVNGVSRFIRNIGDEALARGRDLHIITSTRFDIPERANIHNVRPIAAMRMPKYEQLELVLPPLLPLLRLADRMQPTAIHISTPGPVGMIGVLAARMLRVPVLGVYHTDFPAYIDRLFQDQGFTWACGRYMSAVYTRFARVFTRSADYAESLERLGVERARIVRLRPGIDTTAFNTAHRDEGIWERLGSRARVRILYVGRVSVEKNLPMLAKVWSRIHASIPDAELVIVGDGPYRAEMERELAGKHARFLGFRHGQELSAIYATSDIFAFPSTTDTLGQVVMEAQSSGMPVLVTDEGGPKEVVRDGITGHVLPAADIDAWGRALATLVRDDARRRDMGEAAHESMREYSIGRSFEHFWEVHEEAARGAAAGPARNAAPLAVG